MAARSSGIFPREKFDIDADFLVTATDAAAPVTLKFIKTIRVGLVNTTIHLFLLLFNLHLYNKR